MKAEYSLAPGKACLSLPFHVTSTMLMLVPYAMTRKARLRMYDDDRRYLKESPRLIDGFFFFGPFF